MGADLGDRGQRHPSRPEEVFQRGEVDRPVGRARHHLHGGTGQAADLKEGHVVAVVGDPIGDQSLSPIDATTEGEAPQRLGPGLGVRAGDHHLIGSGAQQPRRRDPQGAQAVSHHHCRLVPAPFGLESQMAHHGLDRGRGGKGGPGVVEMGHMCAPGCGRSFGCDIDGADHSRNLPSQHRAPIVPGGRGVGSSRSAPG